MRLKFIEYIINAACVVNADARRPQKRIAHLSRRVFRFDGEKRGELERVCTSRCDSMNYELLFARQNTTDAKTNVSRKRGGEYRRLSNATRKMLNGKKLSRDGKANFLISGDAFLPTNW